MPSITRDQFHKWNAQAQGGFVFDFRQYCIWGDKELIKQIDLGTGKVVQFRLCYFPEYETRTNGCTFHVQTGRHIPTLDISIWRKQDSVLISNGGSKQITVGDPQAKKNYKVLCNLSGTIDTDKYMKEIA
jgi:hypothetical protein